ncbi:hypothetical protein [Ponticoccus sp. (in: a-proteobacteria)]|uniref:hypothetical protein n=1 Tax=Ponticoccus sp. (in: a-proteobacteria) TaxID=1925025 RepID=UPI003AB57FFF
MQLLAAMVPALEQLKKEGQQGQKKINQYTRYGTVALALFRPTGLRYRWRRAIRPRSGLYFRAACVITLSAARCS